MLVKYFGYVNDGDDYLLRLSFLKDGLFRITQPKFLNDKGSESRVFPYFNEFSPADYAWAINEYKKVSFGSFKEPTKEFLEINFLRPMGERYGDILKERLKHETGFNNMSEYDKYTFIKTVEELNVSLVESISMSLGVFSLSKSDTNEHMWTHYSSEGKGIAVAFNKEHSFFIDNDVKDVSYAPEMRAFFTFYRGSMRLNGYPLKQFYLEDMKSELSILTGIFRTGIDFTDFTNRILYSKSESWSIENEARVVLPLSGSDSFVGAVPEPKISEDIRQSLPQSYNVMYPEVCLKKIPFSAFDSVIFGYETLPEVKDDIVNIVRSNSELDHVKFKRVRYNIYGNLEVKVLDL
jgi:hypothetical protein